MQFFARDVGDYQKMKTLGWSNIPFWSQELGCGSGLVTKRFDQLRAE